MAVYSELIKNFEKIREYVRDFYIFGFHTRESFDAKSKRNYSFQYVGCDKEFQS